MTHRIDRVSGFARYARSTTAYGPLLSFRGGRPCLDLKVMHTDGGLCAASGSLYENLAQSYQTSTPSDRLISAVASDALRYFKICLIKNAKGRGTKSSLEKSKF